MLDPKTLQRIAAAAGERPMLIALSGGGDSAALLHLLAEHFGAARLRAGVIDHALRRGSESDAARALAMAAALGVQGAVTTLTWDDGANRSQHAARLKRYRALCAMAHERSARVIVTGHTRDDQAETVLMRAARNPTWRALGGMRAMTRPPVWPEGRGLFLARPLLRTRREPLRAYLRERGASWIDDPANDSPRFERVVARKALAREEAGGLDPMRLAAIAETLAPHLAELDAQAAALIARAARFEADTIVLTLSAWDRLDIVSERALWLLITAASGAEIGPHPTKVRILDKLMRGTRRPFTGVTLGGVALKARGGTIVMSRDKGALRGRADGAKPIPPLPLTPNQETIWDGRVALTMARPGWSVVFEADAARLARGEDRAELAAASPSWLLQERLSHLLECD